MSNPALSRNPAFNDKQMTAEELDRIYDQPSAETQRPGVDETEYGLPTSVTGSLEPMTYENAIQKTVIVFLAVLVGAAAGWFIPALLLPGAIIGLILGLVNAFKKEPSPALIMLYGVSQGAFIGAISMIYEQASNGIVMQAVLGTFSVFTAVLLLFRSGKIRESRRMTQIWYVAMIGYLIFSLLNIILMLTGVVTNPWGLREGWLGIAIGLLAVLLASYSLVMDFTFIKNGVNNRIPEKWGWTAAFGLTVTLIWLYLEILRLLAIFRGN